MATLVFSAVGAAVGAGFGGTVLGLSGAVIGRAVGATIGASIDQRILGGGSEPVEMGRIDRLRIDGDNWQQTEVTLGEETELYSIRVVQGTTVLAEYASNAPSFTYTPAAQTLDGVSGAFKLEVAQVSTRFGAGPFRAITIPA